MLFKGNIKKCYVSEGDRSLPVEPKLILDCGVVTNKVLAVIHNMTNQQISIILPHDVYFTQSNSVGVI